LTHSLIDSNIETLKSGISVIEPLTQAQYSGALEPYFTSSVGKHFRHLLDHYLAFLAHWQDGFINYDQRDRDERIESLPEFAIETIQGIIKDLKALKANALLGAPEIKLRVNSCTSAEHPEPMPSETSLERELVFLHCHTVHHYALISTMLKLQKLPISHDFGIAPSTLVYENAPSCVQQPG